MNSRITIVFIVDNNSKQLYSQFNEDTPICFMRTYVRDVLRVDTFQLIYKGSVITNDMLTLKQIINIDDNSTNVVFHVNSKCKCERKAFATVNVNNNKCGSCKQYRNAINELRKSNDVLKEVNAELKADIALTMNNVDNVNDTHYKYLYYKYRELYFQEKQAKENIIHHHQLQNNNNSYINVLILNCVLPFLSKNDIVNISVTSKYICEKCLLYVMNYVHKTQLHLTHVKQWNIWLYNKSFSQRNKFQLSNSTLKYLHKASNESIINVNEATFYNNNTNVLKLFKVFNTFRRKLLEVNVNDNSFVNAVMNELQQGIQCNNGDIVKYLLNEIEMFDFTYNTINDIIAIENEHNDNMFGVDSDNNISTRCNLVKIISLIINEAFIHCGITTDNNNNVTQRSNIIKDITHLNTTYNKYTTIQTKLNTLIHLILPE